MMEIDHKRLLKLFYEFARQLEEWHTLYLDSIAGYSILHERLLARQEDVRKALGEDKYTSIAFQDTCSVLYKNLCNKDVAPIALSPVMKQGDVKKRTQRNGHNYLLLGNQCVVSVYSYWEEYLRIEIGIALGKLRNGARNSETTKRILNQHVKVDLWGDLRYLRNSIVHNHGIANSDLSKCKVIRWFKPGERIVLDYDKMRALFFVMGCYRNKLHTMSLPPSDDMRILTYP